MDLRALRYFVSAVNEGSISAAAVHCHVAQPSITLAIGKLEDQFNCQLLLRHRKGVNATAKGLELYHMAIDLLQHADTIESRLGSARTTLKLSIALDRSVQVSYVDEIVRACKKLDVAIEFEISAEETTADIRLCTQNSALRTGPFFPIANESYMLLIPTDNDLAFKPKLSFADLDGQAIIERRYCENHALFDKVLEHFDLHMPVVATVDNEEWGLSLVAAGLGISISPLSDNYTDPRFKIRRLDELSDMATPDRQVGICFNPNTSSDIQEILDELSRHLTKTERSSTPILKHHTQTQRRFS